MKPFWKHNCQSCVLIGQFKARTFHHNLLDKWDIYYCANNSKGKEVNIIARYSDDGPSYISATFYKEQPNPNYKFRWPSYFPSYSAELAYGLAKYRALYYGGELNGPDGTPNKESKVK